MNALIVCNPLIYHLILKSSRAFAIFSILPPSEYGPVNGQIRKQ